MSVGEEFDRTVRTDTLILVHFTCITCSKTQPQHRNDTVAERATAVTLCDEVFDADADSGPGAVPSFFLFHHLCSFFFGS